MSHRLTTQTELKFRTRQMNSLYTNRNSHTLLWLKLYHIYTSAIETITSQDCHRATSLVKFGVRKPSKDRKSQRASPSCNCIKNENRTNRQHNLQHRGREWKIISALMWNKTSSARCWGADNGAFIYIYIYLWWYLCAILHHRMRCCMAQIKKCCWNGHNCYAQRCSVAF